MPQISSRANLANMTVGAPKTRQPEGDSAHALLWDQVTVAQIPDSEGLPQAPSIQGSKGIYLVNFKKNKGHIAIV